MGLGSFEDVVWYDLVVTKTNVSDSHVCENFESLDRIMCVWRGSGVSPHSGLFLWCSDAKLERYVQYGSVAHTFQTFAQNEMFGMSSFMINV